MENLDRATDLEQARSVIGGYAKRGGIEVRWYSDRSRPDKADTNGFYENGAIYINENAENPYMEVFKHELFHALSDRDKRAVTDFFRKNVNENTQAFQDYKMRTMQANRRKNLRYSDADFWEEYTAQNAEFLLDEAWIERLARTDRNLAQRILDWIRRAIQRIGDLFSAPKDYSAEVTSHESGRVSGLTDGQLRKAQRLYERALNGAREAGSGTRYSIETLPDGKRYVQADRQVITGNDPKQWAKQVERYINDEIRQGKDVTVYGADGDPLTITRDTAGKARFRNYITYPDGSKRRMNNQEYGVKLRAESHIDEVSAVSNRGNKTVPDTKNHDFAKDGFNYRTAYYRDTDGTYYRLTISVGKNGDINSVYNIGKLKEAPFPDVAQRPDSNAVKGEASNTTIPQSGMGVNTSIRESDGKNTKYSVKRESERAEDQINSSEFKAWFGDWENNPEQASKVVNEDGTPKVVYHGTARGDRVGNVFLPERATSGPMAFFTDSQEIAERYAKDKSDTSISYDSEYDNYYTQFRVNRNGKSISVSQLWNFLTPSQKNRIKQRAGHITWDDDMENIIYDENAQHGNGGLDDYTIHMHKGNVLEALTDSWLESGELYGNEEAFRQVLKLAGITQDVEYRNPDYRDEKVYEVFLNIKTPFDTSEDINDSFINGFKRWYDKNKARRYQKESNNADMWDKNSVSPEMFIERVQDDIANGTSRAWTSIPDAVSDYLKECGYDGIKDTGGKMGGEIHTVWIPFESTQIKSATDNVGTFDGGSTDIRHSLKRSKFYDSIQQADTVADEVKSGVQDAEADYYYRQIGNEETMQKAVAEVEGDREAAGRKFLATKNDVATTDDIAKGFVLLIANALATGGNTLFEQSMLSGFFVGHASENGAVYQSVLAGLCSAAVQGVLVAGASVYVNQVVRQAGNGEQKSEAGDVCPRLVCVLRWGSEL